MVQGLDINVNLLSCATGMYGIKKVVLLNPFRLE